MQDLDHILKSAQAKIEVTQSSEELNKIRIEFLGKQSLLTQEMKKLTSLEPDQRRKFGEAVNQMKEEIHDLMVKKALVIETLEMEKSFAENKTDLTLAARKHRPGSIHPITQATEELIQVFAKFGLAVKEGPTIESDWYNFTALNIHEDHPARQMHDTFYLKAQEQGQPLLLRTHTSTIQIRTMQNGNPPFRFIAPGRTYRSDSDMTHTPMFHQIEGLVVDEGINMRHLKYVIIEFIRDFFEQSNIEIRFRPSFFPFTEPSAEVDIKMQGSDKWLEVLGCGMVHPNVLKNVNIDNEKYRGFAFGLGVERFAMLKYGMKDLRQFFEGDIRWLKHYNFSTFDIPSLAGGLTK